MRDAYIRNAFDRPVFLFHPLNDCNCFFTCAFVTFAFSVIPRCIYFTIIYSKRRSISALHTIWALLVLLCALPTYNIIARSESQFFLLSSWIRMFCLYTGILSIIIYTCKGSFDGLFFFFYSTWFLKLINSEIQTEFYACH